MTTLKAKITNKKPVCPKCGNYYPFKPSTRDGYGVDNRNNGFWFIFICENCSTKKNDLRIKYFTDKDLKVVQRRAKKI